MWGMQSAARESGETLYGHSSGYHSLLGKPTMIHSKKKNMKSADTLAPIRDYILPSKDLRRARSNFVFKDAGSKIAKSKTYMREAHTEEEYNPHYIHFDNKSLTAYDRESARYVGRKDAAGMKSNEQIDTEFMDPIQDRIEQEHNILARTHIKGNKQFADDFIEFHNDSKGTIPVTKLSYSLRPAQSRDDRPIDAVEYFQNTISNKEKKHNTLKKETFGVSDDLEKLIALSDLVASNKERISLSKLKQERQDLSYVAKKVEEFCTVNKLDITNPFMLKHAISKLIVEYKAAEIRIIERHRNTKENRNNTNEQVSLDKGVFIPKITLGHIQDPKTINKKMTDIIHSVDYMSSDNMIKLGKKQKEATADILLKHTYEISDTANKLFNTKEIKNSSSNKMITPMLQAHAVALNSLAFHIEEKIQTGKGITQREMDAVSVLAKGMKEINTHVSNTKSVKTKKLKQFLEAQANTISDILIDPNSNTPKDIQKQRFVLSNVKKANEYYEREIILNIEKIAHRALGSLEHAVKYASQNIEDKREARSVVQKIEKQKQAVIRKAAECMNLESEKNINSDPVVRMQYYCNSVEHKSYNMINKEKDGSSYSIMKKNTPAHNIKEKGYDGFHYSKGFNNASVTDGSINKLSSLSDSAQAKNAVISLGATTATNRSLRNSISRPNHGTFTVPIRGVDDLTPW